MLGTGASIGVPVIGCRCRVCTSTDPRDCRTRSACLIRTDALTVLIDTGPDFRQQALREGVNRLDALLITHHHQDHVAGLDDLRPYFFRNGTPLPCYASEETRRALRQMFPWIFNDLLRYSAAPKLLLQDGARPFVVVGRHGQPASLEVTPIVLPHGLMQVLGFRIGRFAYLTDMSAVPQEAFEHLGDLDVLVLDALRYERTPIHLSIGQALRIAARVRARQTYLTHMTHTVLHRETAARMPRGVALAYDGLSFEVPGSLE